MRALINSFVVLAVVIIIVGMISRVMLQPFMFGLEANAFLSFANTCLLFSIALSLIELVKSR